MIMHAGLDWWPCRRAILPVVDVLLPEAMTQLWIYSTYDGILFYCISRLDNLMHQHHMEGQSNSCNGNDVKPSIVFNSA